MMKWSREHEQMNHLSLNLENPNQKQTAMNAAAATTDTSQIIDYSPFLADDFDPRSYANHIIHSNPSQTTSLKSTLKSPSYASAEIEKSNSYEDGEMELEGDVSAALSRLNLAIEYVQSQIKQEVSSNASAFLARASSVSSLQSQVQDVRVDVDSLQQGVQRLEKSVCVPYSQLLALRSRTSRLQRASVLVGNATRFVTLAKRLEEGMVEISGNQDRLSSTGIESKIAKKEDKEEATSRALARTALLVAEMTELLESQSSSSEREDTEPKNPSIQRIDPPLTSLDFVRNYLPQLQSERERITDMMEDMVVRGLRDLSPTLLSTSLQTSYNLRTLPSLVKDLLADLTDVIKERISSAFDTNSLSKEAGTKEPFVSSSTANYTSYKPRQPSSNQTLSSSSASSNHWSSILWKRLSILLVGEMSAVCSKVYTLERVLEIKRDGNTGVSFLQEGLKVLGDRPSLIFWRTVADSLREEAARAGASSFVQQTLSNEYPKLLRILKEFFAKTSVYTYTVYEDNQQSPETILLIKSFSSFENAYLARVQSRFSEVVLAAFPSSTSNSSRKPAPQHLSRGLPGAESGTNIARALVNELDHVRLDPLLIRQVTKRIVKAVESFVGRVDELRADDSSAYTLTSAETTSSQSLNSHLTNATYSLALGMSQLLAISTPSVLDSLKESQQSLLDLYVHRLVDPLLTALKRKLDSALERIHLVDWSDSMPESGGASSHMNELTDRIWNVRERIFSNYEVGEEKKKWILTLSRHVLRTFILHASILKPLGENGKLRLTNDMTELEFSLSQLLADGGSKGLTIRDCGKEGRDFRAFKPLLFLPLSSLPSQSLLEPSGPSRLIVWHYLLILAPSSFPLSHSKRGLSKVEFVRWISREAKGEDEALSIVGEIVTELKERKEEMNERERGWLRKLEDWKRLIEEHEGGSDL